MTMPAFDTYEYISDLEKSGVGREQAEALSKAHIKIFRDLMEEKLATKAYLQSVKTELKQEISSVKADLEKLATKEDLTKLETKMKEDLTKLETKMEVLTYKLTIRLGSVIMASVTVATGMLGFLMPWALKGIH